MKKRLRIISLAIAGVGMICGLANVGSVLAYSIVKDSAYIDVGNLDTLEASTYLKNSAGATELDWVKSEVGDTNTLIKNDSLGIWYKVFDATGPEAPYAHELKKDGGYFLLKTGNFIGKDPNGNNVNYNVNDAPNTFLFKNDAETWWAVIDFNSIYDELESFINTLEGYGQGYTVNSFDVTKFSHITEYIDPTPAPEPATMFLFATGLLSFLGWRRRK